MSDGPPYYGGMYVDSHLGKVSTEVDFWNSKEKVKVLCLQLWVVLLLVKWFMNMDMDIVTDKDMNVGMDIDMDMDTDMDTYMDTAMSLEMDMYRA